MKNFDAQIARIKEKLIKAKNTDTEYKVFGAESHKYKIEQPVTEIEIIEFEKKYNISLPEDYKAFLLKIGNGGNSYDKSAAGPYYGIYPMGENVDELVSEPATYLSLPVKIYPVMTCEYWENLNQKINNDEEMSDEEYDKEIGEIFSGILPIGSQGCTYLHGIILNGKYKGKVVNLDADRQIPKFAYEPNFLDWYERWLDEIIAGDLLQETAGWYGYCMGGSIDSLIEKYFSYDNVEDKIDCLIGLLNKYQIPEKDIQIFEEEFKKNTNELKHYFLRLLTKFNYQLAKPYLLEYSKIELLPALQNIYWYAKERSNEWVDMIKSEILKVEDEKTFDFCCYILKESGIDFTDILTPFLKSKNKNICETAKYTLSDI